MTEPCRTMEPMLAEVAIGRAAPAIQALIEHHTATCPPCSVALREAIEGWNRMDDWQVEETMRGDRVVTRVRDDLAARTPVRLAATALGLGAIASAGATALLHLRAGVDAWGAVLACAGIWAGAFALAFFVILSHQPVRAPRAALWTSASLLALSAICPPSRAVNACERSAWIAGLLGTGRASWFVVGVGYGLVAAIIGLVATRPWRASHSAPLTLAAIGAFQLPVFYLQCQPFAVGALVAIAGGAVAASLVAGLAEHGFARRARQPVT